MSHMKFWSVSLIMIAALITELTYAQSIGDYRSRQTGNWNSLNSWETFDGTSWISASTFPSSQDGAITISNGDSIVITEAVDADQILVETGGKLNISSQLTLNDGAGDDLKINGSLNIN